MKHAIFAVTLLLAACAGDEEAAAPADPPQGRAETRAIRNTEAVGYSGNAIADKVDGALDKNDEAARQRQEAANPADEAPP